MERSSENIFFDVLNYFLLNNFMHESVGGQECLSKKINFKLFAKSTGFKKYIEIYNLKNFETKISESLKESIPTFINVLIKESNNEDLPRVKDFKRIQNNFMKHGI